MSLDALRGFDMLWIMGGDSIGHAAAGVAAGPVWKLFADQIEHVAWEGFRFYDLIFPLFVFMAGISLVFSLGKMAAERGKDAALVRLLRRSALLYVIGIFYYGGLATPFSEMRLVGVLHRIAIAYFFAGTLFLFVRLRTLIIAAVAILLGYWALLTLVPIRDISIESKALGAAMQEAGATDTNAFFLATTNYVRGGFEEGKNVVNHFDFRFLPGRKWDGNYDPEGVLSNLPAVVTCLLGVFAGLFLKDSKRPPAQRALWLAGAGVALVILGSVWGIWFPVIKKLWTSSYVLVAGGYSCLLLAAFYYVIDVREWRTWCRPLLWVGMNSIAVYLAGNLVSFDQLASRLVGGNIEHFLDAHLVPGTGEFLISLMGIALVLWLARMLYRRNLFFRI